MGRWSARLLAACALVAGAAWALDRALPPDITRYELRAREVPARDGRLL